MKCPQCFGPLDSPTRKLCVSCIGDAVKSTGENTYSEKIHDAKLRAADYRRRNGLKKTGETWWK
jgi:hypothetical protein